MLGIAVAFEKEGIDTGRMTNEMYFSMYSAFSQEESTSIAKNMRKGAVMQDEKWNLPSYPKRLMATA